MSREICIPISQPSLGPLERAYLLDAFDSGWISSRGAYIERAESAISVVSGAPFAAVTNNGTTALHLALLAAGVGPGDEVILPSLTYIATLNAVYYVGATPIIVDVEADTWCVNVSLVERAITSKTAAVIGVDLYGQPANYAALRQLTKGRGITLIADAAESIGATYDNVPTGSLADVSTFSFFGNKVLTSGEGGAVTTHLPAMHERVLQLRNQGNHASIRYRHDVLGYNYRMTNLSAAVLTAQLERSEQLIAERRRVIDQYERLVSHVPELEPQRIDRHATASPWLYSVRLHGVSSAHRNDVMHQLEALGIETRPVFLPVQEMAYVPIEHRASTPVASRISAEGLSLPTYPDLRDDQIARIVSALVEALNAADPSS